jgi:hypothetical protein
MYNYNNQNIKTQLNEMTVAELETCLEILNRQESLPIEKYIDVIQVLGASQKTLDEMTDEVLFDIIKEFNKSRTSNEMTLLPRTFTDNGVTYEAYPEGQEFSIRVKQLAMLEKVLASPGDWYSGILTVLFKRPEHSMTEHFNEVNVKKRLKLFKDQPADLYFGYILKVNESILKNANPAND